MGSGPRAGYYFSAAFVLAGTAMLSLIDVHKNNLRRRRRRRRRQNSCKREEEVMMSQIKLESFVTNFKE